MLDKRRVAIIGSGNMGEALIGGILRSTSSIIATDKRAERLEYIKKRFDVEVTQDNRRAVERSDVVILAVKPQSVREVLGEVRDSFTSSHTLISIAAGIRTEVIESALQQRIPVVRVMPNLPALVGCGVSGICGGRYSTREALDVASAIFSSIGKVVRVEEEWMDAITGLSGSGPAYVFLFMEALIEGGVKVGLPRDIASIFVLQTVKGASEMVERTSLHPAILKDKVTSPGGTTASALHLLEERGFRAALISCVEAAVERAKELRK